MSKERENSLLDRLKGSGWLRWAQRVWVLILLVFLAWYFSTHWRQFADFHWSLDVKWIVAGVAAATLRRLLCGIRWVFIALYPDQPWTFSAVITHLRVYFYSGLAIYIPGNVWFIANRIVMSKNQGMSVLKSSMGMGYEMGMGAWTGILVGSFAGIALFTVNPWVIYPLIALFCLLSLVMFHEGAINYFTGKLLGFLKRPSATIDVPFSWTLKIVAISLMVWFLGGTSLVCLLKALAPQIHFDWMYIISAAALAWVIGFATPWAPSGLGVQEGFLVYFLRGYPAPIPVTATICLRLLYVAEDVFWVSVLALFFREKKAGAGPTKKP